MIGIFDSCSFFFFNDTATTEIYTLSLHDALPIFLVTSLGEFEAVGIAQELGRTLARTSRAILIAIDARSEEHTSELQSRQYLVCRLLLEKKKKHTSTFHSLLYLLCAPLVEHQMIC